PAMGGVVRERGVDRRVRRRRARDQREVTLREAAGAKGRAQGGKRVRGPGREEQAGGSRVETMDEAARQGIAEPGRLGKASGEKRRDRAALPRVEGVGGHAAGLVDDDQELVDV